MNLEPLEDWDFIKKLIELWGIICQEVTLKEILMFIYFMLFVTIIIPLIVG